MNSQNENALSASENKARIAFLLNLANLAEEKNFKNLSKYYRLHILKLDNDRILKAPAHIKRSFCCRCGSKHIEIKIDRTKRNIKTCTECLFKQPVKLYVKEESNKQLIEPPAKSYNINNPKPLLNPTKPSTSTEFLFGSLLKKLK